MTHLGRLSRATLIIMVLGLTSLMARTASADDADDVATYAVQRRLFRVGLELNAGVGLLPLNSYDKGFVAEGNVTYHISSTWAWEIAQAAYVFAQIDTDLRDQLVNNFGVRPTQLPTPQFLGSSNVVFTPFYGKLAGLNHSVSHIELFFPIGPALGRYQDPGQFEAGVDIGLGLRWFLTTHMSLRIDARDFVLSGFSQFSITQEVLLALGLSVEFGGPEQ